MNDDFAAAMRRAALSTRAYDLMEATRIIQDALAGRSASDIDQPASSDAVSPPPQQRPTLRLVGSDIEIVEPSAKPASSSAPPAKPASSSAQPRAGTATTNRLRRPLGETIQALREGRLRSGMFAPLPGMEARATPGMRPPMPDGAQFLTRSFSCAAGTRSYKIYRPASAPDRPRGLVVMLHGCKQDPDDFAAGTNMNTVAEANGLIVAYPVQTGAANASSCWNWFNPADQTRDAGEPSIIAGITRELMSEFGLDRQQVFVAGLSAGGAMAAVMAETYPDLYAAAGVHSGLAYGSANDAISAFAAMRGNAVASLARPRGAKETKSGIRMIVFQGGADQTVHPSNAERIVGAAVSGVEPGRSKQTRGCSAGGRTYTRSVVASPEAPAVVEYWLIDGAGHAWSGGQPCGSYTDPQGPDASSEMVRFFLS